MAKPVRLRPDGVAINYDPYAPGIAEKYGMPGKTDNEGFDPYRDSVGPGIYGGIVTRDEVGEIVIGRQYQVSSENGGCSSVFFRPYTFDTSPIYYLYLG